MDGNEKLNVDEKNPEGKINTFPYNFYSINVRNAPLSEGQLGEDDTEFWNKPPTVLRQASDNQSRLLFNAYTRANWIYDLKMLQGELFCYSMEDRVNGLAFGLQERPFVADIDFIDHNFVSLLTKDKEAKWKHTNEIDKDKMPEKDLEETLLKKLPVVVKSPDSSFPFLFAVENNKISLVNIKSGKEYLLVKQRVLCNRDCLEDLFLTYERNDESVTEIKKISLHYFEKYFDYRKKPRRCTYNVFELTDDFIHMITTCGEILPNEKTQLVNTIKTYKDDAKKADAEEGKDAAKEPEAKKPVQDMDQINASAAKVKAGYENSASQFQGWLELV